MSRTGFSRQPDIIHLARPFQPALVPWTVSPSPHGVNPNSSGILGRDLRCSLRTENPFGEIALRDFVGTDASPVP